MQPNGPQDDDLDPTEVYWKFRNGFFSGTNKVSREFILEKFRYVAITGGEKKKFARALNYSRAIMISVHEKS